MDFKEHLSKYLSKEEIADLMTSLEDKSYSAVLLNKEKMTPNHFISLYPNVIPHPIIPNSYIYNKDEYPLGKSIFHELGCFYIQEPSAMLVSYLLNPNKNDLVLDMCAAPGGKTIQASLLMENEGLIISNDISYPRLKALKENVERMGRANIVITNNDFSSVEQYFVNTFDKIILDAPCSGCGMFRKEDKMLQDWSIAKVYKNAEIQKKLILSAYNMLKPGGIMAYSTCSFSYEEDEEVVSYLLDNSSAELVEINDSPYFYKSKNKIGIHLFPSLFKGEGHYICLIKKPGNNINQTSIKKNKISINQINYLSFDIPKLNKLNVLRNGLEIGDNDKYSYQYTHYVKDFSNQLEIDEQSLNKYMKGESLNIPNIKGHVLLKYQGINVDIAKGDGRIIKNKLPKFVKLKNLT